jgi:hypothetical protein
MMAAKLSVASAAPRRSNGCAGPLPRARLSGMRGAKSRITSTRGRLRRKINLQDQACMSQPPTTGPMAANTVVHPDQLPMARPRSFSGKDAERMERPWGISSAAPIPWIARVAMSWPRENEAAHPTEARAKSATPHI